MSEEEKEAIAYLNKYIKIDLIYEQKHYNKIEIVLNLINKLQKENKKMKDKIKEIVEKSYNDIDYFDRDIRNDVEKLIEVFNID